MAALGKPVVRGNSQSPGIAVRSADHAARLAGFPAETAVVPAAGPHDGQLGAGKVPRLADGPCRGTSTGP
jgi:hypothetical protein